jgi:hypothetical protein
MTAGSGLLNILRHSECTEKYSSADNFDLCSMCCKSKTKVDEIVTINGENIEEEQNRMSQQQIRVLRVQVYFSALISVPYWISKSTY